jgi:hypothetical protein
MYASSDHIRACCRNACMLHPRSARLIDHTFYVMHL